MADATSTTPQARAASSRTEGTGQHRQNMGENQVSAVGTGTDQTDHAKNTEDLSN